MDGNLEYIVKALEAKKRVAPNGEFFWTGRDLAEVLTYTDWRNFRDVIEKAKQASNNAGIFSNDHFVEFTEEIIIGKGAKGKRENLVLSRHACYLIAMNADPTTKPEVATAQNYFAVQTQRQEIEQQLTDDQRRLLLRNRVKDGNKALGAVAYAAGVTGAKFGIFHDAGYKGLYDVHGSG